MDNEYLKEWAIALGLSQPLNGSWIQAISDDYGSASGSTSYLQAITKNLGISEVSNGSHIQSIAEHYGATEPLNGSWLFYIINNISGNTPSPGTLTFGSPGTSPSNSLGLSPFTFGYDYGFAAWIITAAELGSTPRTITSIEMYLGSMSDSTYTMNNQSFKMAHIDRDNWTGDLPKVDLIDQNLTGDTQVRTSTTYNYDKATQVDTWIEFPFTSDFAYNGIDSIVIYWANKDDSYNFGGPLFDIENITGNVAYKRRDNNYPSGSCFLSTERPIMKLNYS
jgi:hypothetical protein